MSGVNTQFGQTTLVALGLVLMAASTALGQTADSGPDPDAVRLRIGPLWMNPTISMPNLGIDTNVFNDPPTVTPRRDLTLTIAPKIDLWLRLGRTWLSATVAEDVVWYQKYATERSANGSYVVGWKAPFNRLVLTANAQWRETRTRPGFEIDARAQRNEPQYDASVEIRGFGRTFLGVRGAWGKVDFDDNAVFDGSSLQEQLDRTTRSAAITMRHDLTPLTSIIVSGGRSEEKFKSTASRNSTADEYSVAINFAPAALLNGTARVGYILYNAEAVDLDDYHGATAAVNLVYTLRGATQFTLGITRAIESSYDINHPNYVLTGVSGSLAQHIFGPVDLVARGRSERLQYRSRSGAVIDAPDRADRVQSFGAGLGVRVAQALRLGFNIDKDRRMSLLVDRQYEGLNYGISLTWRPI
jgi:hypothetical protein